MSTLKISEAGTVQFPMVKHAVEIGWTPITPDVARAKRGGEAGTFFRDVLEAKLAAFNSWMSADAVRSVVETLDALPASIEGTASCCPGYVANASGTTRRKSATALSWSSSN